MSMSRHTFDVDSGGIELSSDILIYSSYPDAATPQEHSPDWASGQGGKY
jgi:hypothetical protein